MSKLVILNHPLIDHKMTIIRNKETGGKEFRETVSEIGMLITYEVSRGFKTVTNKIETPLKETKGFQLEKPVVIIPILRAGLGMVEGVHRIIPNAKIGHIGLYREADTFNAITYYSKLPDNIQNAHVLVVDPMLATGGTAVAAVDILKKAGAKDVRFIGLVGAPEGVKVLHEAHPDVDIYLASLDSHLNELGYIVPGLGDCGDRLFGTK